MNSFFARTPRWERGEIWRGLEGCLSFDPVGSIGAGFAFPDGDFLFEGVNTVAAGVEGGGPVRGAHGNDYGDLSNLESAGAVVEGDFLHLEFLDCLLRNFLHFCNGHWFVGFKFEAQHWLAFGAVTHRSDEHVNAAGCVVGDEGDATLNVERGVGEDDFKHFFTKN